MKEYLTYDDVNIRPKFSDIKHRSDCNISTRITKNVKLDIPIVSSPMDTVTESQMCIELDKLGGMGILHRFTSMETRLKWLWGMCNIRPNIKVGAAIGVTDDYVEQAKSLVAYGADVICIDVAHGHHILVKEAIWRLKDELKETADILVGNIASKEAARDLCEWGADGLRVGIGGGSLCSTRIQTGVGIPMVSSIRDCVSVANEYDVPCMADGGIRNIGDVCKGIACGADTVMLGSLLSGTKESPGEITKTGVWPNEILQKKYRGSASLESKQDRGEDKNVEGVSHYTLYKGKTKRIINDIIDGLKSSMSYVGAGNIEEYQSKAELIKVTNAGIIEASPHGLK